MAQPQINSDMTLGAAFTTVAGQFPSRLALITPSERLTYSDLSGRIQSLAGGLQSMGIRKGDRIALLLWSGAEFVSAFFASALLGAVVVPLSPRQREEQVARILRRIRPAVVMTSTALEVPGGIVGLKKLAKGLAGLQGFLVTDDPGQGDKDFRELLRHAAPTGVDVQPGDLAAILHTSGTTGEPKGVLHAHRGLITPVVASIRLREMWFNFFPTYRRARRWVRVLLRYGFRLVNAAGRPQAFFSLMSAHTIAGVEAMLQPLLMGDRLVLLPKFHPVRALETIEREHVTVLIAVPQSFAAMMRVQGFERYRLRSLLICGPGAAPCPADLAREIQRRFGCAVHVGFGMTELGGGISSTSLEDSSVRQWETVGRAMPGMEVRVVDDAHRPLAAGRIGELACRSESRMLGYDDEGNRTSSPIDDQGWLYTGDLACIDEDGYIHMVGRKKDLIIRGGQNIIPAKVEAELLKLDGVLEAAVVGVPDQMQGESIWAFLLLRSGCTLVENQVVETCRARLESYEVPQRVRMLAEFPRAEVGKVQKNRLREQALEEMRRHVREPSQDAL